MIGLQLDYSIGNFYPSCHQSPNILENRPLNRHTPPMIMPIQSKPNYPDWNPKDKQGSLIIFGKFLHQTSKEVFLDDKKHQAMAFTFEEEKVGKALYIIEPDQPLKVTIKFLKDKIKEDKLYAVIHSCIGVTTLSPNHPLKCETLLVSIQARDGFNYVYADEIERKGNEVSLGYSFESKGIVDPILGKLF